MSKWEMVKLGDMCSLIGGGTPERSNTEYWNGSIPWISVKDFKSLTIDSAQESITELGLKNSASNLIPSGTIVIPTRMALGKVAVCSVDAAINQDLKAISINDKSKLLNEYLIYTLLSKSKYIESRGKGATVKGVTLDVIKSIEFPLPPLDIQKQIVARLELAQAMIDQRKQQVGLMDDLIQSTFYEMFGDPVKNEKGWKKGTIGDLAIKTQYGTSEKADETTGEFPVLRMNNISYQGGWDFSKLKYINLNTKDQARYLVHKGELLFNRTNSKELVGKTAVFRENVPMAFAGYLVKLTPNKNGNAEYISAYLNSPYGKLILLGMAKSIVGMANINAEELKSIPINIPPIELQNIFADKVHAILRLKNEMAASLTELEQNFNALMQQSFAG
ncbi:restriction endonuclease subunit S [Aeromonas caviae]